MSRFPLLLLTLIGALFALSPRAALAQNPPAVPIQLVKVNGPAANLCLQTARVPGDVQNRLVPATCMDIGGLQMFSFLPVQGGGYRIVNTETFHCLDVEWGANGAAAASSTGPATTRTTSAGKSRTTAAG